MRPWQGYRHDFVYSVKAKYSTERVTGCDTEASNNKNTVCNPKQFESKKHLTWLNS